SVLGRIELCTPLLDKLVKALGFQQLIQLLVKGMPRRGCQLGVCDPQSLLLLPLLARAHRHRAILRTMSVDTSDVFAYEPRLAPRAVRQYVAQRKEALGLARRETFVPQSYDWGVEAQVDWYEAYADLDGERVKLQVFSLRSMASGAAFHRAYL